MLLGQEQAPGGEEVRGPAIVKFVALAVCLGWLKRRKLCMVLGSPFAACQEHDSSRYSEEYEQDTVETSVESNHSSLS